MSTVKISKQKLVDTYFIENGWKKGKDFMMSKIRTEGEVLPLIYKVCSEEKMWL